jgi:hypothetical protein
MPSVKHLDNTVDISHLKLTSLFKFAGDYSAFASARRKPQTREHTALPTELRARSNAITKF